MRDTPNFYYNNPRWRALPEELVFEQEIQGSDTIFPGYLLALFVSAAVVSDGDFVDPAAQLGSFDGDLRLEAEAVGSELDFADHVGAKQLVAKIGRAHV